LTRTAASCFCSATMAALLDLVRKLIDYGKELAETLHQRVADNRYFAVFNYATNDLELGRVLNWRHADG